MVVINKLLINNNKIDIPYSNTYIKYIRIHTKFIQCGGSAVYVDSNASRLAGEYFFQRPSNPGLAWPLVLRFCLGCIFFFNGKGGLEGPIDCFSLALSVT
jgi:hypothetical protein